ncbi:MAG: xanthine dehydrogenase family protein molybdopterin-binding subunit, partial [Pusillimonas sp.]
KVRWRQPDDLVQLNDLGSALRAQPYKERVLVEKTDAGPQARAGVVLKRTYIWPYQMHASIGPSCSVADFSDEHVRVWSGSQSPHMLRTELSQLLKMDEGRIEIIRMEASGCYGRNCADDACGDAVLLSRAVGHPVRVQLTREQEHGWEPKGAAQLMDVTGSIDAEGNLLSYDFVTRYPSNDAPTLALTLTGTISSAPRVFEMGDRTAVPPYSYPNMRVACLDMAAIVRAAWLRGVSAMPNSFAHDSFIDELAVEAGRDPVAFRLQYLSDDRASALLRETAVKAQWRAGWQGSRGVVGDDGMLHGRGVSYARYVHSRFPGYGAAWAVWFVDVAVHPTTGRVIVKRVVVGQDVGMMVNPAGVRHQLHGNIIQSLSRALKEHVAFDARGVVDLEWGAYPILGFTEIPPIEVYLAPRQDQPPMGAGESSSVPSAAAVGNALFDATGVRFREVPFTPDCILQGLRSTEMAAA